MSRALRFGENVNTDVILPGRYLNITDAATLAGHVMEGIDPQFGARVRPGDVLVAGANFGCGSSREHAPMALKAAGISSVLAVSFARIFYRNAINIGLPVVECEAAARATEEGDALEIDLRTGRITNLSKRLSFTATPFPLFLQQVIDAGGLIPYLRGTLQERDLLTANPNDLLC